MKKFWAMFMVACVALSSCQSNEKQEPEVPQPVFILTSSASLNFEAEGGEAVVTYSIENPTPTGIVTATVEDAATWVTEIRTQTYGEVAVVVAQNEVEESRTATLTLTYEDQSATVELVQAAGNPEIGTDYVREATVLTGLYYGRLFSDDPNYFFHLSNVGFNEAGEALPGGWFYTIDCYSVVEPSGDPIRLPEGTYEVDVQASCAPNTINPDYSMYFETGANGETVKELLIMDGSLVVTESMIELRITDELGQTHYVYCENGDYAFMNVSGSDNPDNPEIDPDFGNSNLPEDLELDTRYWMSSGYYYGDYYGIGYGNWLISFFPETGNGDRITLDFIGGGLDPNFDLSGTYACSSDLESMVFAPGFYYDGYIAASWYTQVKDGYVDLEGLRAPLVDGMFQLTKNDDGTYTLVMEVYDNAESPHKISGSWTGILDFKDVSSAPARESMSKPLFSKKVRTI